MISIKGFIRFLFCNYYLNIIVDDLKDKCVTILGMITNKNNIDAYKYQNMVCTYCQKTYMRYGAYMKHMETCKYKFKSSYNINSCKIQGEDNHELLKCMNNEITNLRNEVCELRRMISLMLNQQSVNMIKNVPDVPDDVPDVHPIQNTISSQKISKIKIIDNTSSKQLEEIDCVDCIDCIDCIDDDIDFDTFISRLDFCNQSQLLDIFDSDDLKDSFFFLWNEAVNKLKYNNTFIPMKYINNRIIIYEKKSWCNLKIDKLEKVVSYLHQKIVQQLSIYQTTPNIKSRIENETSFRDYYLNQVTKINSDKLAKSLQNNFCEFIENIGKILI